MNAQLDMEAARAFREYVRAEAAKGNNVSAPAARQIWTAAWIAARTNPAPAQDPTAVVDESALRRLVNEYRDACEMVQGHAIHQWRNLLAYVRSLTTAGANDAARLDSIEEAIRHGGAVWFLPSGEENRFVQVRTSGECRNFPTVSGLRNAIDAAFPAQPSPHDNSEKS